jgi:hypothetical protein
VPLLAGSGKCELTRLGEVGVEVESYAGSSEAGAGTSPFPGPRTSLATDGVNLQVSGSSHYFASGRLRFRRSFADHVAAPADRTAGEVLEPAHF